MTVPKAFALTEDGEVRVYIAENVIDAIAQATAIFVAEEGGNDWDLDQSPKDYFHRVILESARLIGEVVVVDGVWSNILEDRCDPEDAEQNPQDK